MTEPILIGKMPPPPNFLQRWYARVYEFFYLVFKGKFFIVLSEIEKVDEVSAVVNEKYHRLNLNGVPPDFDRKRPENDFAYGTPKYCVGFLTGLLYVMAYRRKFRDEELKPSVKFEVSLITVQDYNFINLVTGS